MHQKTKRTSTALYKTTIVIWSEENPIDQYDDLEGLARQATNGNMHCSSIKAKKVETPKQDPDWDGTDFFDET